MSSNPNSRTSPRRERPSLLIQRKVNIPQPIPRPNARKSVLIDDNIPEVSEVDDECSVVAAESEGGVGVATAAGGHFDPG